MRRPHPLLPPLPLLTALFLLTLLVALALPALAAEPAPQTVCDATPGALADKVPDSAPGKVPGSALPFCSGEKLTYRLSWEAVPAGQAVLEILPVTEVGGLPALHFRMTAETNDFVDVFYKVRDKIDSFVAADMSRSLLYLKKQREGSYKRDITVDFLYGQGRAQYSNTVNGPKEPIIILPGTFDPLSVFYAFRLMPVAEGASVSCPVSDGVKCVIGGADVIRRETITVPAGTFDTWLVQPELRHIGGVFKKSKQAKLNVWVSADERLIPVRISSSVVVGRFFADLTEARLPDCSGADTPGESPAP